MFYPTFVRSKQSVILVVVASNDSMSDDVVASINEKKAYASKHGHGFQFATQLDYSRAPGWSKLLKVKELIPKYPNAWFWVVDTDTVLTNDNVDIVDFIPSNNVPNVLVSEDCNALNTGSLLIKSGQWSMRFINEMFSVSEEAMRAEVSWAENSAFICLYKANSSLSRKIWVAPAYWFNAYTENGGCIGGSGDPWRPWQKGDLLIHFPGMPTDQKVKLMRQYRLMKSTNKTISKQEIVSWWE